MRAFRMLALLGASLLAACASTKVTDVSAGHRDLQKDLDEAGLWFEMDRAEKTIAAAPERITDPALQQYLDQLNCKLAPDLCADVRVYLIRQPYFNAFMAPNGMMVIFTGTLIRTEDEAQLATVMAHEIGHYRGRHSLENWRHLKNVSNLMTGISAFAGSGASVIAAFGAYANLASFSREQERDADTRGFTALQAAKLDLQAEIVECGVRGRSGQPPRHVERHFWFAPGNQRTARSLDATRPWRSPGRCRYPALSRGNSKLPRRLAGR
jgi:beta-barrel assembly-enhancing protease